MWCASPGRPVCRVMGRTDTDVSEDAPDWFKIKFSRVAKRPMSPSQRIARLPPRGKAECSAKSFVFDNKPPPVVAQRQGKFGSHVSVHTTTIHAPPPFDVPGVTNRSSLVNSPTGVAKPVLSLSPPHFATRVASAGLDVAGTDDRGYRVEAPCSCQRPNEHERAACAGSAPCTYFPRPVCLCAVPLALLDLM